MNSRNNLVNKNTNTSIVATNSYSSGFLTNSEWENLNWDHPFGFKGLIRIRTPPDGSCFFHAITKSYFLPYITGKINGKPFNRQSFIRKLRADLAKRLGARINPKNPASPTFYDTLSRGELRSFAESVPFYSLENMQKVLNSNLPVDNVYNEFISNQLDKDIYILDMTKKDVYITGQDTEILYKNRPSIVILYLPGHYELVGLKENGVIKTLFEPTHNLIKSIRNRMDELWTMEQSGNN